MPYYRTKKQFNKSKRRFNSRSKGRLTKHNFKKYNNRSKKNHEEHVFKKLIRKWQEEIKDIYGYAKSRPSFRTNKIKLNKKPFDIRHLSSKFNKIAKKTFRTNLYNKNRAKYFNNLLKLYIIFSAIQKNISRKSAGLGIPSKNNLPPYVVRNN